MLNTREVQRGVQDAVSEMLQDGARYRDFLRAFDAVFGRYAFIHYDNLSGYWHAMSVAGIQLGKSLSIADVLQMVLDEVTRRERESRQKESNT